MNGNGGEGKDPYVYLICPFPYPLHLFSSSLAADLPPPQALCKQLSAPGLSRVAQRRLAWSRLEAVVSAEEGQGKVQEAERKEAEAALKVMRGGAGLRRARGGAGQRAGGGAQGGGGGTHSYEAGRQVMEGREGGGSGGRGGRGLCPSDSNPSPWFPHFQAMGRVDLRKKASEMREWDEEELRMLDRALAKFPQVGGWVVERGGGE